MNPTYPPGYLSYGSIRAGDVFEHPCRFCGKPHLGNYQSLGCEECKLKHVEEIKARQLRQKQRALRRHRAKLWIEQQQWRKIDTLKP